MAADLGSGSPSEGVSSQTGAGASALSVIIDHHLGNDRVNTKSGAEARSTEEPATRGSEASVCIRFKVTPSLQLTMRQRSCSQQIRRQL